MDDDARKILFEMNGTVQRLEEKTDTLIKNQGQIESEIENLEKDIEEVEKKAQRNKKKIHVVYAVSTVLASAAGIAAAVVPPFIKKLI